MLDPADWLEQAQQLPLGGRRHIQHICGGGNKLLIEHKDNGYSAWCYRCSDKGWHPHPQPSLAERIAKLNAQRAVDAQAEAKVNPPVPTSFDPRDWPLPARVWLYKAGFSNESIQRNGFYFAAGINRVVLPIIVGGRVVYWQARGFDPGLAKYINPPIDKPLARYGDRGPLVVTEDVLSAARVGEVCRGVSALGTSLSEAAAVNLKQEAGDGPIIIWLDDDDAGRRGRAKFARSLRQVGARVSLLSTPKDPKLYSRAEIEEFLQSASN